MKEEESAEGEKVLLTVQKGNVTMFLLKDLGLVFVATILCNLSQPRTLCVS